MAQEWAIAFAALFATTTAVRIYSTGKAWQAYIPGGIAVAVGKLKTLLRVSNYVVD